MKKLFLIQKLGGVCRVAEALEIKPATVSGWPEELPYSVKGRVAQHLPAIWAEWQKSEAAKPKEAA